MGARILVDTDVCIDYLRGRPEAVEYLEKTAAPLLISAVTVAELFAGVRDGGERGRLEEFLRAFAVVAVDDRIAERGGLYRREYRKSHATGLADALLAATAEISGAALATISEAHSRTVAPAR